MAQTQAPVKRPVRHPGLYRISHSRLSSWNGTYSNSNNLKDSTMIKQCVFITSVVTISASWAGCTNREALMPWPGTKLIGVCNADGKMVAAGAPAKPCPPPQPFPQPKIYGEHPVAS